MSVEAMKRALESLDLAQQLLEQSQHHAKILSAYEYLRQTIKESEKREWLSLTQDEFFEVYISPATIVEQMSMIEANLKEKNT